ncbi:MAG TPA: redoxin family protein [Atopostipes sp.]|nr:redoxin family protein [Atopostipes sp.]
MQVTFKGEPLEVKGTQPKVGDKAPDVTVKARNGDDVQLYNFITDKPVVVSVVPDVETRTCELQTKNFADKLAEEDVIYLTVSRNTVDQFNDWNKENDLNLVTLSDTNGEFGREFGLEIDLDGNAVLARSVFLLDADGVVRYVQIVPEVVDEPDYKETLAAIKDL